MMIAGHSLRSLAGFLSWQALAVFIQAVCQFLVLAVVARFLLPDEFGLFAAASVVISILQMIAEGGAGAAVVQSDRFDRQLVGTALLFSLVIGLVASAVAVASAWSVEAFFDMDGLKEIIWVMSGAILLLGISKVPEGIMQRQLQFRGLTIINLTSFLLGYTFVAIAAAALGLGVWALVAAGISQILLKTFLLLFVNRSQLAIVFSIDELRRIFHFGFGVTQIRIWNALIRQVDRVIVGRYLGSTPLGQVHLGSQLAVLPGQYVGDVLDAVFFPLISRVREDQPYAARLSRGLVLLFFSITSILGLFFVVNAELLILLICGEKWLPIVPFFQVLCLGLGIRTATRLCDVINRAYGSVYKAANRRLLVLIVSIIAVFFGKDWGIVGVAWALLATNTFSLIMAAGVAAQGIGIKAIGWFEGSRGAFGGLALFAIVNVILFELAEEGNWDNWSLLFLTLFSNGLLASSFLVGLVAKIRTHQE